MFKWTHSEEINTEASAEQIWAMWEDVATWPCWDYELEWAELPGAFKEGTVGRLKPKKGPKVTFTLDKVIKTFVFLIMLNFLLHACVLIMNIFVHKNLVLQIIRFVIL
nr:hypothetical protein [Bartonella queenslandensis]